MQRQTILLTAMTILALAAAAPAVVIQQGATDNYVKFQAASYDSLVGGNDLLDNGDGTLTTTDPDQSRTGTVQYQIDFAQTGTYYLYFNNTAAGGGNDSIFLTQGVFGDIPSSDGNGNRWNGLSGGDDWDTFVVTGEYANNTVTDQLIPWEVTAAGVHTITMINREDGLVWKDFVFSSEGSYDPETGVESLSSEDLNALAYSVIPEPTTMALLGLGGLVALRRRRTA
jgi:hypothetical protein